MTNTATLKMLIIAEATRIIELLNAVPVEELKYGFSYHQGKNKAELKTKMAELRRDTVALEKKLYVWEASK